MKLINKLISDPGYLVLPIPNMKKFTQLKNKFVNRIGKNKNIDQLRKDLSRMSKSEINKTMIKLLSFNNASDLMLEACKDIVKEISGKKIFIQRRANIIFNLPGEEQRRQWPHYELMSGISPYTFVMWAPFHDLDDEGGVYYLNQNKSLKMIKKEENTGLVNGPAILNLMKNFKSTKMKYGEVIVFNPFILHGNNYFKSDKARIACSIRFQSREKPLMQKNSDFFKTQDIN